MYNDDDSTPSFFILIGILSVFFVGAIGFSMGEQFSQQETINFCVEKPADCKIKYDYYKLENKK